MRRLIIAVAVAVAVLALSGCGHPATSDTYIPIVAHRGASTMAPENTLAAFEMAAAIGADRVETDVQETKDHKLVLMHDVTLKRTTNAEKVFPHRAPWRVRDFTLAEIKRLDAGSWMGNDGNICVPTLSEALDALRDEHVGLVLEAKNPKLYPGMGRRIDRELRRHPYWRTGDANVLMVSSVDWSFLRRFHAYAPYVLDAIGAPTAKQMGELTGYVDVVGMPADTATRARLDAASQLGLLVQVWGAEDDTTLRRVLALRPYAITTDDPQFVRGLEKDS